MSNRTPEQTIIASALLLGPAVWQAMQEGAARAADRNRRVHAANARLSAATANLVRETVAFLDGNGRREIAAAEAYNQMLRVRRRLSA